MANQTDQTIAQVSNGLSDHWAAEKTFVNRDVVFKRLAPIIDDSLGDYFGAHLVHKHDDLADNQAVVHRGRVAQPELIEGQLFPIKWTRDGRAYEFADETAPAVDEQVLNLIKDAIPPEAQVGLFYLPPALREPGLHEVVEPGKATHEPLTKELETYYSPLKTAWCRVQGEWQVVGIYMNNSPRGSN